MEANKIVHNIQLLIMAKKMNALMQTSDNRWKHSFLVTDVLVYALQFLIQNIALCEQYPNRPERPECEKSSERLSKNHIKTLIKDLNSV